MKRFSDFAKEERPLDGEKVRIEEILNYDILIKSFRLSNSNFSKNSSGKYAIIQFIINDTTKVLFTGSDVLIDQLTKYKNELPFFAKIIKINRYYTLS